MEIGDEFVSAEAVKNKSITIDRRAHLLALERAEKKDGMKLGKPVFSHVQQSGQWFHLATAKVVEVKEAAPR